MKKKKYIIPVQANALITLKVNTDTTLLLCLEAQKRGYKIFWYHVNDLSIDKNKVSAKGYFVKFFEKRKTDGGVLKDALFSCCSNYQQILSLWGNQCFDIKELERIDHQIPLVIVLSNSDEMTIQETIKELESLDEVSGPLTHIRILDI